MRVRAMVSALLGAWLSLVSQGVLGAQDLTIGYLELQGDPRYREQRTEAQYSMQPLGRPYPGAEVALQESKFAGSAVGVNFALDRVDGKDVKSLLTAIDSLAAKGVHFFLADLPANVLDELARATKGRDLLLFNVSAPDDDLRQAHCQAHLLHLIPSYAMRSDALVQYLVSRKWRRILVLVGPRPEDAQWMTALERSAKRFGAQMVAKRPFVLGSDPRERERNNIALLTAGEDYDVVFVVDSDGEFARSVPYRTVQPRPVVGSEGLIADGWHWSWERYGAPQLDDRFERRARRRMTGFDWAAWMGVKAVVEAVLRTKSTDFRTVAGYLRGDQIVLDGFKGYRLNFRPWDNQLRQPLLLATHNWVVERAPLPGFLHAINNLDTLGFDKPESRCRF